MSDIKQVSQQSEAGRRRLFGLPLTHTKYGLAG